MINKMNRIVSGFSALALSFLMLPAQAQDMPVQKMLPLELANQAAMAAVKKCLDDGHRVSVAIVDQSGLLKVQVKADGAGPLIPRTCHCCAHTCAATACNEGRVTIWRPMGPHSEACVANCPKSVSAASMMRLPCE